MHFVYQFENGRAPARVGWIQVASTPGSTLYPTLPEIVGTARIRISGTALLEVEQHVEVLIVVVLIAIVIGGVALNHHNRRIAFAGVEFTLDAPADEALAALEAVYCQGAKATLRQNFTGVRVRRSEEGLAFTTKLGDEGVIEVSAAGPRSFVRVVTTSVYIGNSLKSTQGSPVWQASKAISHLLLRVLGVAPNAAKLKRFQRRVEPKLSRHLGQARTPDKR